MPRSNSELWKWVPLPCVQCCCLHTSQNLGQARNYHFVCVTCRSDGASGCSTVTSSPEPLSLSLHLYLFCLTPSEAWNVDLPLVQNLVPLVGLRQHFFFFQTRLWEPHVAFPTLCTHHALHQGAQTSPAHPQASGNKSKRKAAKFTFLLFTFTFTIELPRPSLL